MLAKALLFVSACLLAVFGASHWGDPPMLLIDEVQGGTVNSDMPPMRFQGNNAAVVVYTDQAGIHENCGRPEKGFVMVACRRQTDKGVDVLFMPNPCLVGGLEFYAKIACHELGHVNGWSGDHEP